MPKQKLPNDHCTEPAKVGKTEMQTLSQTRDQTRNQILSPVDQVQSTEILKQRLFEANSKIQKLQKTLNQAKKTNKTLCKYHEGKVKAQNDIVERQNASRQFMSSIQYQANELADTLKGFQESHEDLTKFHENLNFNQAKIKDSAKRLRDQIHDNEELKAKLISKTNELSVLKNMHQQFENEMMEKRELWSKLNDKRKDYEKLFKEKRNKHFENVSELSRTVKDSEEHLKIERERKNKLMEESNKSSKRMEEESISKLQVLQLASVEYEKQEEVLKSSTQMLKEKLTNLDNEKTNLESEHLEIISRKNSEFLRYKKQLQDSKSMHTESLDKLKEIISENDELLKYLNKLKNKDNELIKINSELTKTLAKNEESSVNILTLKEELIVKEDKICQLKVNYESRKGTAKKQIKEQAEIKKELAMSEEKLKDESDDTSDLLAAASDEKKIITEQIKKLANIVDKKKKKIIDIKGSLATIEREFKDDESRYSSEIQQKTDLAEQCGLLGHEEKIKELNTKIDILNRELSSLKLVNTKKATVDRKKKEEYETELNELKSNFDEWNDKFSALQSGNKALEEKLKNAKTLGGEKFTQEVELSHSMPAPSPLKPISKSNSKNDSPLKVQKERFDFPSDLNIESIDGLKIMKEAERRFKDSTVSDRPDWAKLDVPTFTEESEKLPFVNLSHSMPATSPLKPILKSNLKDSPLKAQKVRFHVPSNSDTDDEDCNDPYAFK